MNDRRLKVFFVFVFSFLLHRGVCQNALTAGNAVPEIAINKILNNSLPATTLKAFSDKLTIVDFFGTWCAPCLRALPHLTSIKKEFEKDIDIVLISNETEAQLVKFIKARSPFPFPVIVDEDGRWNATFQPPSLPYTVVIKLGKVIAITTAEAITADAIQQWMKQPNASQPNGEVEVQKTVATVVPMLANQQSKNEVVRLSQRYIYAAKTGEPSDMLTQDLSALSLQQLASSLITDNAKKAFWINIYNGYTQIALQTNAEQYKNRNAFFGQKALDIAGTKYSLDNIEHGILRRSKIKWSLGYLNKLFPSKKEKELRVQKVDYRIHFALNCGAKSCPPIAFYNNETLDAQLDQATKVYLTGEADYDSVANVIRLPKLMSWFRADFGGKKGMLKILRQHNIIAANASPTIKFKDYDWSLTLNNYSK